MAIEWRECVAAREDLRRAIESLEQGAQCRLNFEHDFRAELFDLAGIAAELDRVAERLLRVEENRLPRERRIATRTRPSHGRNRPSKAASSRDWHARRRSRDRAPAHARSFGAPHRSAGDCA